MVGIVRIVGLACSDEDFYWQKKERNGEMMWVVNGVREYRGNEEKKTKRGRGTQTLGCMVGVVRIVGLACSDEDFNGRREKRKWEMLWVVNGVRGYKGKGELYFHPNWGG